MNDWIKWGEADPPRFLQRFDETVFVVRNETVTQTTNENKNPAMKGNRNPFAQNSVRSMKAACKGRKVIK